MLINQPYMSLVIQYRPCAYVDSALGTILQSSLGLTPLDSSTSIIESLLK